MQALLALAAIFFLCGVALGAVIARPRRGHVPAGSRVRFAGHTYQVERALQFDARELLAVEVTEFNAAPRPRRHLSRTERRLVLALCGDGRQGSGRQVGERSLHAPKSAHALTRGHA